ncbi:hypothetical protein H6G76_29200 [Nostoc sp. FACHB-152]|uniref:hypothetical protein n=1 Tax=unclassified Nostoc TaxID=2593658 RepID=UPI0016895CE3|nr:MULTISPECIES: hypothetical protein [unclassified Nostoc]MBD2451136.1 hypothetical protein [Nostoc sp. FACHB-152]MBD2473144.1 hypothetical protein [Nostoc sp. FACHB-145]
MPVRIRHCIKILLIDLPICGVKKRAGEAGEDEEQGERREQENNLQSIPPLPLLPPLLPLLNLGVNSVIAHQIFPTVSMNQYFLFNLIADVLEQKIFHFIDENF